MPQPPNVLFIMADHWPGSLLGAAGHPVIQTPTFDQIAHNGIRFNNCYSECPVCVPARRTIMTGTSPRFHGDRVYDELMPMPAVPTLAQCFRDAGYQAFAVGKLHTCPQRNRIGFDDVTLNEEGRIQYGVTDDYEQFLSDRGFYGRMFESGMCNNEYITRPWHLPDDCHPTNWATREMCRTIRRRDPTKPSFLYLSYMAPHPPLWPLACYMDMYRNVTVDEPVVGAWAEATDGRELPPARVQARQQHARENLSNRAAMLAARQAFYALCTHIDHQLRVVLGQLREAKMIENTILMFTSDHGDMLGNQGIWGKSLFYEGSACVPLLLSAGPGAERAHRRVGENAVSDQIVGQQDLMPTLLDLCGLPVPKSVEGVSIFGAKKRTQLFGEIGEGNNATRMIRRGPWKLIYYPVGNRRQLFNLDEDPAELNDLAGGANDADDGTTAPATRKALQELTRALTAELHGGDEKWVKRGKLAGLPERPVGPEANYRFSGQRGMHWK